MRQLFQNLISNGIKFRRDGVAPVVKITGEVKGDVAEIEVSDNGIGFDPRYAGRIFRVFERLHGRERVPRHRHRARAVPQDRRAPGRDASPPTAGPARARRSPSRCLSMPADDLPLPATPSTSNGAAEEKPLAPV